MLHSSFIENLRHNIFVCSQKKKEFTQYLVTPMPMESMNKEGQELFYNMKINK